MHPHQEAWAETHAKDLKEAALKVYEEFLIDAKLSTEYREHFLTDRPKGSPESRYHGLLREMAKCQLAQAIAGEMEPHDFEVRLRGSLQVVTSILRSLRPEPRHDEPEEAKEKWKVSWHQLWYHSSPDEVFNNGLVSPYHHWVDVEGLAGDVAEYLQSPWMQNDELEWMMVDALVYAETTGTGEAIKQQLHKEAAGGGFLAPLSGVEAYFKTKGSLQELNKLRERRMAHRFWWRVFLYLILPAIVYAGLATNGLTTLGNLLGGIYLICAIGSLFLATTLGTYLKPLGSGKDGPANEMLVIWNEMKHAYAVLGSPTPNPAFIKHRLLAADGKGAVWNPAIFALLESAIAKSPDTWALTRVRGI